MFTRLKWGLLSALAAAFALFLLYYLPFNDVVRIVGTEVARRDAQPLDTGATAGTAPQDIRFIKATDADGDPVVYRNEDTGWGWPLYFKFDSADLAARADAMAVEAANAGPDAGWTVVTHYGWRIEMLGMFPNAVDLAPATGPNQTAAPWTSIVILVGLALIGWRIARLFRRPVGHADATATSASPSPPAG